MTSTLFNTNPYFALAIILLARIAHGVAESLFLTGALTWGIGLVGSKKSGKVMIWNGIVLYSGIAIGAPVGIWISYHLNIEPAFGAIIFLSVIGWLLILRLPKIAVNLNHIRTPFYKVIGQIAQQGLCLAFSTIGFAYISSFISLLFVKQQWGDASLAFIFFGGSYVLVRILFSSFPDKFGGNKVTLVSLVIEIIVQLTIAFSTSKLIAIIGCSLTGAGFSLIFPSLGVLAIQKIKPQMRGTALGAYAAFFDLSLGLAAPVAGLVANWFNYQAIYLFGGISCLIAVAVLLYGNDKNEKKNTY